MTQGYIRKLETNQFRLISPKGYEYLFDFETTEKGINYKELKVSYVPEITPKVLLEEQIEEHFGVRKKDFIELFSLLQTNKPQLQELALRFYTIQYIDREKPKTVRIFSLKQDNGQQSVQTK